MKDTIKENGNTEIDTKEKQDILVYESDFVRKKKVTLTMGSYMDNNAVYLGLMDRENEKDEFWCDVTVNLGGNLPPYCGYLDTDNSPGIMKFVEKYHLGKFTGIPGYSGFRVYPLYKFDREKLRELCPDEVELYERLIGYVAEPAGNTASMADRAEIRVKV